MQIPGFEMQELIGEGAMAFVWKARQKSLDRVVAVKMLKPRIARNPEDITSFLREARTAAALKHPGIVQIYDIAECDGSYYLVLEFINGPTVGHLIARNGPMPVKRALTVCRSVADALDYAWERAQLIHRDIKPHNILVDADGTVKLSDLGLARTAARGSQADDSAASEFIEGTPNYISPEQARGASQIDCRSDMYSLGATLYHMVTGRIPFGDLPPAEAVRQQVFGQLPNPRDIVPDLPIGVAHLITRLMMRTPNARFASWPEAAEAIRRVAAGRLMMSGRQPEGESTVAAAAAAAADGTARAARRQAQVTGRSDRVPAWFRTVAWSALLALWAALVWHRMHLPPLIPIPERSFHQGSEAGTQNPAPAPESGTPAPAAHGTAPAVGSTEPPIPTPPPERTAAPALADTTQERLGPVTACLMAENFAKAEELLTANIAEAANSGQADALRALRDFVVEVARMPSHIEGEFMRRVGTDVSITHNNQTRVVRLKVVTAGKVFGEIRTNPGAAPVPVQFEIAQLSPIERSRWLGASTTPAVNAMRCILLIKGGDTARASALAPKCGPLSPLLQAHMTPRGK